MSAVLTYQDAKGLFLLDQDMIFLNHGSFGSCPRPVFEAYQAWQRELERQPVAFLGRSLPGLLEKARTCLAGYVGAVPDNLVFVPNATQGMNIIARSLRLAAGDEVLLTDHEYGAVARTWRFTSSQTGAGYRSTAISLPFSSDQDLIDQLWRGITDHTRVLVISHVSSPTSIIFPVSAICERARTQGILTVIDGAHAPGQLGLQLDALGADFYLGNCHKWLSAPKGSGFLYARPEQQLLLSPLIVSWGWEAELPGSSLFQDYFGWTGTTDPAAYLSVPAAIEFQQQYDWASVRAVCHDLARQAEAQLRDLYSLPSLYPGHEWFGQMCSIAIPRDENLTARSVQAQLWESFRIEVPIIDWESWRMVRVSIQAYNSAEEVDLLVSALRTILSER
jgi:isopenicillin-N epimerase